MIRSAFRRLRFWLNDGLARKEDLDRLYDQLAGLDQIHSAMTGGAILKPLRGWALSPDAMALILADLQELDHPVVIEFGSGQSTLILAAALRHQNGRLVSVEHDPEYAAAIMRQIAVCGLSENVQFVDAPIITSNEPMAIHSYDLRRVPEIEINLAIVDGPPYTYGKLTRLAPLRWATTHLKSGGVIFLDDSNREAEQACLKLLKSEYPDLTVKPHRAEKGLAELRFR